MCSCPCAAAAFVAAAASAVGGLQPLNAALDRAALTLGSRRVSLLDVVNAALVVAVLLAALFLKERLTPLQVVGFVVGVGGVLLVLGPDGDEAGGADHDGSSRVRDGQQGRTRRPGRV